MSAAAILRCRDGEVRESHIALKTTDYNGHLNAVHEVEYLLVAHSLARPLSPFLSFGAILSSLSRMDEDHSTFGWYFGYPLLPHAPCQAKKEEESWSA